MKSRLKFDSCLLLILLAQVFGYAQNGMTPEEELEYALKENRAQLSDTMFRQRRCAWQCLISERINRTHQSGRHSFYSALPDKQEKNPSHQG